MIFFFIFVHFLMFYDVQYGQIQQFLDIKFVHLLKLSFFVATYYCVDIARWNGALSMWKYTHFGAHDYLKNIIMIFNSIYLSFDRRHSPHTLPTMHPIKETSVSKLRLFFSRSGLWSWPIIILVYLTKITRLQFSTLHYFFPSTSSKPVVRLTFLITKFLLITLLR